MKFALMFANAAFPDAKGAARLGRLAEEAGFDSVITVEHVIWPTAYSSAYPYSPTGKIPGNPATPLPDPLIWMAWVAATTTRLKFMTGVVILPQRNPLVLAKEVATLDHLSGGRIELGIGVGWLKEEFDALGVPFEQRGKRADEYIGAMRALWSADNASFAGNFVKFSGVSSNPKPPRGNVPIIVGGHSEAAAQRAGRLGDGFFPLSAGQGEIGTLIDIMKRAADKAGRDGAAIGVTTTCPGLSPKKGGDPRPAIEERVAQGVSRVVVPVASFMPDLEDSLPRFGEQVIRPFAGA
ncbi:MAG TPA: LLM class F420-dependent oxidoreductase [Vineibacter sp.]|nr:LLM class F420-dependent oxidoreductase [Vineibacter sp.]